MARPAKSGVLVVLLSEAVVLWLGLRIGMLSAAGRIAVSTALVGAKEGVHIGERDIEEEATLDQSSDSCSVAAVEAAATSPFTIPNMAGWTSAEVAVIEPKNTGWRFDASKTARRDLAMASQSSSSHCEGKTCPRENRFCG